MIVPLILLYISSRSDPGTSDFHAGFIPGGSGYDLIGAVVVVHELEVLIAVSVLLGNIDIRAVICVCAVQQIGVSVT